MSDTLALVRLLQLASPALPVGAFSYSQGLEGAVEAGIVRDAPSAHEWIDDVLGLTVAGMEAPILWRLIEAWKRADGPAVVRWNDEFVASRETAELRAETLQMGYSLRRLIVEMGLDEAGALGQLDEIPYPAAYAFAVVAWQIDPREALAAYLFTWVENQVLAALKAIPLGQTDGQRLLRDIAATIPARVERAASLADDELCNFAPGLAMVSSRHESQYSRIFRS